MNEAAEASPLVDVFPVAIGRYQDVDLPSLAAETQVGRLVDLLARFGACERPWATPEIDRGAGAVERRLRDWAESPGAGYTDTLLYWVGHGWSDGINAALAHGDSPVRVGESGVTPEHLADIIRVRQATAGRFRNNGEPTWAMVVIDACRSQRFVERLVAALKSHNPPQRVLLIGVSSDGATTLGRFTDALRLALSATFRAHERIRLLDLAAQFYRLLPGCEICPLGDLTEAALVPVYPPVASWMSAPLDDIRHLEDVVADLSPDERRHFLVKAQGAEHGEMSWFFEGREDQRARINSWLRDATSGMLIVSGRAGSGKSALLGNVLVHSLPELRDALARRGLVISLGPHLDPPHHVFDAVIHLSGLSLSQATMRVAHAAGIGAPPSQLRPDAGIATDLDWLTAQLAVRHEPLTVLADALDEAVDPLDIGRSLLARIAVLPTVRVVIGTRISTNETPDAAAADRNLLDALASESNLTSEPDLGADVEGPEAGSTAGIIWVERDPHAIYRYVQRRLTSARDRGADGFPSATRKTIQAWRDQDVERVALAVAQRDREFLYARLAVYEILEEPRLLTSGRAWSLEDLLEGNHTDLFDKALQRLATLDDRHPILLEALSLTRGRGLPEADGIWATIAGALAPRFVQRSAPDVAPGAEWAEAIHDLLGRAAAYVIVDTSASDAPGSSKDPLADHRSETVYRLAHRTFVEHFSARGGSTVRQDRQNAVTTALLATAATVAEVDPTAMPHYLAQHLSGHVSEAEMWDDLGNAPAVLDGLAPHAVTADALRTLFGRRAVPASIAGILGARDALAAAAPRDRPGLRQLAMTIHGAQRIVAEPVQEWGVAAAVAGRMTMHARLSSHTVAVNRVRELLLRDGRQALVSAADDGTIRLWDPYTAMPIGSPWVGHLGTIEDISLVDGPDGATLLATAGGDGSIRIWDPARGRPVGSPLTGHNGRVWAICALPGSRAEQHGSDQLLAAGDDGSVRIWDYVNAREICPPLTGHAGGVWGICTIPHPFRGGKSGILLVTAGQDGSVRVWEPITGRQIGGEMRVQSGGFRSICSLPGWDRRGEPDGRTLLATAGDDGTVRIWDPSQGVQHGPALKGHVGRVWNVCCVDVKGRSLLATAGQDGSVRIWDPVAGRQMGNPLVGHGGRVIGVCSLAGPRSAEQGERRNLLASAGQDGTVRIWDPLTARGESDRLESVATRIRGLCILPDGSSGNGSGRQSLLATASDDGLVRIWDTSTNLQIGRSLTGHSGRVLGVSSLPQWNKNRLSDTAVLLSSTGQDGSLRIWDPVGMNQVGDPLIGHAGRVWAVCSLPGWNVDGQADGRTFLATTGEDGSIQVWDPGAAREAGLPMRGHTGRVRGLCTLPSWDDRRQPNGGTWLASTGQDGSVRIWDPVTGQQIGDPLVGHNGRALGICTLPRWDQPLQADGIPLLATTGEDGSVRIWDPVLGSTIREPLVGHVGGVWAVCSLSGWNSAGRLNHQSLLASAGEDGTIRIWDPSSGGLARPPLVGHVGAVLSLCAMPGSRVTGHPDGRTLLVTAGEDGSVRMWDPYNGKLIGDAFPRPSSAVTALSSGVAGNTALCGDGQIKLWNPADASFAPFPASARALSSVLALSRSNRGRLAIGDLDGLVLLADLNSPNTATPLAKVDDGAVLALCELDEKQFLAAGSAGTINVLSFDGGVTHTFQAHDAPIRALCIIGPHAGQPPLLASAGNDGTIKIWNVDTWKQTGFLSGHQGWVWALEVIRRPSKSAPQLISAGADGTVRRWDPYSRQVLGEPMTGHIDHVRAVGCVTSATGEVLLLSGGDDCTIRLWNGFTGEQIRVIKLGSPVYALLQQPPDPPSRRRTHLGATVTVGLKNGIVALDISGSLFQGAREKRIKDHVG